MHSKENTLLDVEREKSNYYWVRNSSVLLKNILITLNKKIILINTNKKTWVKLSLYCFSLSRLDDVKN